MRQKLILVGIICVSILFIFAQIKNAFITIRSGGQLPKQALEVEKLTQENELLKQKIAQAQTPEFVEKMARDQLRMAYPGETVVVLAKEQAQGSAQVVLPIAGSNWSRWYKLFFN